MYRKPGPVITYKLEEVKVQMDEIMALNEFLKLPAERAKEVMLELSRNISDQRLAERWSIQASHVRKLRCILGVHKDHRGTVTAVTEIKGEKWPPAFRMRSRQKTKQEKVIPMPVSGGEHQEVAAGNIRGFTFTLDGIFEAEELSRRMEAIQTLLSGLSASRYSFSISLQELTVAGGQEAARPEPQKLLGAEELK